MSKAKQKKKRTPQKIKKKPVTALEILKFVIDLLLRRADTHGEMGKSVISFFIESILMLFAITLVLFSWAGIKLIFAGGYDLITSFLMFVSCVFFRFIRFNFMGICRGNRTRNGP